ncbi:tyrosine-type recombinase/integrase [Paracoccus sp. IB05]|uniref:tyrosine-type recombinase/integrase n=1 Tax=Paracoccus sp. IB05 TaxID=2779367 RepID=UPI0018E8C067|nr:tyrosine-type recombinase/integrase [Paracoccus sp. IB05]MBJ2151754.1 tyrosine-type recombinase/integrase [Paracoccus sp. IB05]
MGLILKYVEQTKSGSWQYRRRVPKEVAAVITKREFKRKLGDSQKEALAAYPRYHAEVEREIAEALRSLSRSASAGAPGASERDAYAEALRRRASLIAAGATEAALANEADAIAARYPQDEYEPVGASTIDRHTINVLRLGPERHKAPAPTLTDAQRLYVSEKIGDGEGADTQSEARVSRVIRMVVAALGKNPVLASLTREDARKVRDAMLGRLKSTGAQVSAASVKRELNVLKAVINFGKVEFGLPETFQNPFNKLDLGATASRQRDGEKRDPLPPKILAEVHKRITSGANPALAQIWRILAGTGCRIAEITGLRVEDVETKGETPHIRVTWNEDRRLKTNASIRCVPLVGDALEAAKEAVMAASGGTMLFPRYGRL